MVVCLQYNDGNIFVLQMMELRGSGMGDRVVFDRVLELGEHVMIRFVADPDGVMTLRGASGGTDRTGPFFGPVLHRSGTVWRLRFSPGLCEVFRNGFPAVDGEVIRSGDFFQIRDFSFYYAGKNLWTQNREDLLISGLSYENLPDRNSYPAFRRNTRIQSYMDETPVEVLDPPPVPAGQEGNLALRLLPSLGMLAAAGLMAAKGGTAMLVFSGISAGTGVVTAVAGTLSAGKKHRRQLRERQRVYGQYLEQKREELDKAREMERAILRRGYPELEDLLRDLYRFAPVLFERRKQDRDFLILRLGTGNVRSMKQVHYKVHEQLEALDELSMLPERIGQEYMWMKDVPVVCDLKQTAVLGIIGKEPDRYALLRNMVLDLALHQYHSDVKMIFVSGEEHADRLHWLRFLPHVYLDPHFVRGLACDAESRSSIFEYLYRELSRRREEGRDPGKDPGKDAHILIFFYDDVGFRGHPISRFLPDARELGVSFFFFADRCAELVQGCSQVIEIRHPGSAEMTDVLDSERRAYFSFSAVSEKNALEGARFMAPVYTREVSLDPTLTRQYTLFQMLGINGAEELVPDYGRYPAGLPASRHSLAAPAGIGRTGTVYLDIHDSAHGPHGLVAGTTGSGKSELLQTYILSMAVRYHPHEVCFLIIDYKGGGMAGPFSTLPHLLGIITNIDGSEAGRALRSIRAELVKRQQMFEKVQVNHIDRYMQLYGAKEPLAHLVIIIDEFAELKAAQPEFMQELISAARIGRSLGVHLILATQKPSGQVSEQIWSNSRFRICLKVQEAADSKEVLKSPLAAEIREPGRAYLQVGNGEIFELFQSAYSSCPADAEAQGQKEYSIYQISDTGAKTLVYRKDNKKRSSSRHDHVITQMDAVVRRITRYCQDQGIVKLPDVFCPALADTIPYQFRTLEPAGLLADIGWYDDPDHQLQAVYTLDLNQRHVLIAGSSRSGKTSLLETIIRDLTLRYAPDQLHIYIVDYASRALTRLQGLLHVGGVVCSGDREKTESLFRMLTQELEYRKVQMAKEGALAEETPHILLVIDHLAALKELIFQDDQRLLTLCNEGLQAGIHVIAANPLASSIGFRYLSAFGEKIALHFNDSNEYHYLFDHPKETPEELPGRYLVQKNGIFYHGQSYQSFEEDTANIIGQINQKYNASPTVPSDHLREPGCPKELTEGLPKPIPHVPEILTDKEMIRFCRTCCGHHGRKSEDAYTIPAGITLTDIQPYHLDLAAQAALLITGTRDDDRYHWIRWADQYLQQHYPGMYRYFIADGIYRKQGWLAGSEAVSMYSMDPKEAETMILQAEAILKERYERLLHLDRPAKTCEEQVGKSFGPANLLILLIDSFEALETISRSTEAMAAWRNITGRYKSLQICPVISVENTPISFQSPEILRDLRDVKNCLFFGDLKTFRLFEIPYTISRQAASGTKPAEAWHISGADCIAIKTPVTSMTE